MALVSNMAALTIPSLFLTVSSTLCSSPWQEMTSPRYTSLSFSLQVKFPNISGLFFTSFLMFSLYSLVTEEEKLFS